MGLETPWQKITFGGIVLAFLAVIIIVIGWVVQSLNDTNTTSLGHWLDGHSSAIWGFVVGAVPSIAAYIFGKRVAKKQVLSSGVKTVETATDGAQAAERLRQLGGSHGLNVG
jgi:uncharacterized membrane protein